MISLSNRTPDSKRRMPMMADWGNLHRDMLELVAMYLTHTPDHLAFSAVCSHWRIVALDVRPSLPYSSPPFLMIRGEYKKDDSNLQVGHLFSVSKGRFLKSNLILPKKAFCVGSYGGWLVLVHKNFDMSLYNPFSRQKLPLPPITSFPRIDENRYLDYNTYVKAAAVSSPMTSSRMADPKNLVVMVAQGRDEILAFAKPGDSAWLAVDMGGKCLLYSDSIAFYKGKFYAVGQRGTLVCEMGFIPKLELQTNHLSGLWKRWKNLVPYKQYLVESLGKLMMIGRWMEEWGEEVAVNSSNVDQSISYRTMAFTVYQLNFTTGEWDQVNDIEDQVFYVGHNTALSLPPTGSADCKANCIYFTDDRQLGEISRRMRYECYGYDMGVYDLKEESMKPIFPCDSHVFFPPPLWVMYRPW